LEGITVPVHLIVGSEDPVPDVAYLEALCARLPNVTTARWPQAGHDAPLVHGAACRVEIEEFLELERARGQAVG
jgi:pimeloyl-ACP methyl ester carboxylesterase